MDSNGEELNRVLQNISKIESYFVRCFGGEMKLSDDVDFDAYALKQNFQENKEKTKM